MKGFVQMNLPPTFDFHTDFTLSGWICSCIPSKTQHNAAAISLECAEIHESLLQIGEWTRDKTFQVHYHSPNDLEGGSHYCLSLKDKHEFRRWFHVAVTYSSDRLTLYRDGSVQDCQKIPRSQVVLSRVCPYSLFSQRLP
jgi:hypothetical protein